jgi:hypothetical protein
MSIRNRNKYFLGVERCRSVRLTTSLPSVSRSSTQCEILNISQPYRPPRPLTEIALLCSHHRGRCHHHHHHHHHPSHHHSQNSSFWAVEFFRRFCQVVSCINFFGLRTSSNTYFKEPLLQTPNLEYQVPVFMPPSDRIAQLNAQAPDSFFVAFYVSEG